MPQVTEDTEIKELKKEISDLIAKQQTESDARKKIRSESDETLIKMKAEVSELLEKFQNVTLEKDATEKKVEELEVAIEAAKQRGDDFENLLALRNNAQTKMPLKISSEEYVEKFYEGVSRNDKSFRIPEAVQKEETRKWLRYKMPFKSNAAIDEILEKEVSAAYGPSMGWMFPVDQQVLMEQRRYEMTPMRSLATVMPLGTDSMTFPTDDTFITPNRRGELGAASPKTEVEEIFNIEIKLQEMNVNPEVTQKMLRNRSFDIEGWITRRKVPLGFALQESYDFTVGDGVERARGLFTYPAWDDQEKYERDALGTLTTTGTTLDDDDLRHMFGSLIEAWQPSARWLMHRKTFTHITGLKDEENRPLINPQLLFLGTELQLHGKPVVFGGDVPAPTLEGVFTVGQKVIAYGDFSQYIILDGVAGMNYTIRDDVTRKGYVNWYITQNVGGGLIGFQGIKMLVIGSA